MARFSATAGDDAPVIIQLASNVTGAGSYIVVVGVEASVNGASGSVSRPVLYRPSSLGTGTPLVSDVRGPNSGAVSSCTVITSSTPFSVNPPLPGLSTGSFNLPLRVSWACDPANGPVVSGGGAIVFYAAASGGATFDAELAWEEL